MTTHENYKCRYQTQVALDVGPSDTTTFHNMTTHENERKSRRNRESLNMNFFFRISLNMNLECVNYTTLQKKVRTQEISLNLL